MEPPPLNSRSITYQIPRNELISVVYGRMIRRPRFIRALGLCMVAAALFFVAGPRGHSVAGAICLFVVLLPVFAYRAVIAKVEKSQHLLGPKMLTFNAAGCIFTGSGQRQEYAWNLFKVFSENAGYFFLQFTADGPAVIIPKSAFTPAQLVEFRQYGNAVNLQKQA
jgi:hypothetical protein